VAYIRAMCGRATYKLTWQEIVALYRLTLGQPAVNTRARFNVCPTTTIDTILEQDGTDMPAATWDVRFAPNSDHAVLKLVNACSGSGAGSSVVGGGQETISTFCHGASDQAPLERQQFSCSGAADMKCKTDQIRDAWVAGDRIGALRIFLWLERG